MSDKKNNRTIFEESNLHFHFNENWQVQAFDKTKYYKALSGRGFKGVDFIGILNQKTPVLIEAKNYERRSFSPKAPDIKNILGDNPRLVTQFIHKMEDSLYVVRVIEKVLLRKWSYRFASFWERQFRSTYFYTKEWLFWKHLFELLDHESTTVHFVLWLRTESTYPDLDLSQILQLKQNLRANIHTHFDDVRHKFYIANRENNPYEGSLEVKENLS